MAIHGERMSRLIDILKKAANGIVIGAPTILPGCLSVPQSPPMAERYEAREMSVDALGNKPIGRKDVDTRYLGRVVELDDSTIQDFIRGDNKVVLFYNNNIECRSELVSLATVADEEDNVNFGRINMLNNPVSSRDITISPPLVVLYKNGIRAHTICTNPKGPRFIIPDVEMDIRDRINHVRYCIDEYLLKN